MGTENIPERQISKLIKITQCTFKEHGDSLNVVKIENVSIFSKLSKGYFGKWNTKYMGCGSIDD